MRTITLFLTAIFLFLPSPGFSGYPRPDTVKVAMGNVREKPSTRSRVIQQIYQGDAVTIKRRQGKWFYITLADGRSGWAHRVLFEEPPPSTPLQSAEQNTGSSISATLKDPGATVRAAPSLMSKSVYFLKKGSPVRIIDKAKDWYRVEYNGGKTGWVHESLLSISEKKKASEKADTEKEQIQEIKSIQTVIYSKTEEKVIITLNGVFPPETSTVSGDTPTIVCDFAGGQPAEGISDEITAHGQFIQKIEIDDNDKGVRVSVILSPDHDYNIEQVFYKEEKIYLLVIKKM